MTDTKIWKLNGPTAVFDSGLSIGGGRGRGPFIIIRGRWNHGMGNGVGGGYVPTCPRSTGHSVIFMHYLWFSRRFMSHWWFQIRLRYP